MGSGKKDLEIVYNLQWKNVSGHGDDKANIVGMYDIPATTLNWETFKSYLLKNSGATGDDVKVSYISIDDKEFPIESQLDFQIALYSFRQRARNGDIITLKLDRIATDTSRMGRMKRLRRSAEPRVEEEKVQNTVESAKPLPVQNDGPPDWFKKYMKGFKKEIVEEVTASVVPYVSNMKVQNPAYYPCYHSRKSKVECCKRPRKVPMLNGLVESNEKELIKSLKLERKLDSKLEKLEQKTMKIKEKKLALVRPEGEVGRSNSKSRPIGIPLNDTEFLMDASAVGQHESTIPHMSGGETYQQEWEVINTGEIQWTTDTELRYAWGSEALKPVEKTVPCPTLNPGEKGTVVVYLEIPRKPGNYECYWHFYHEGRRFGHWLGCHIIVDPSPVKLPIFMHGLMDDIPKKAASEPMPSNSWSSTPKKLKRNELVEIDSDTLDALRSDGGRNFIQFCLAHKKSEKPLNTSVESSKEATDGEDMHDMSINLQALQIDDAIIISDANSSSDSDNQSIVSIAGSNSSINSAPSDEFVVVPMPQCITTDDEKTVENDGELENLCIPICAKIKLEKIDCSVEPNETPLENGDNNNNTEEVSSEKTSELIVKVKDEPVVSSTIHNESQQSEPGYAYVVVNGQKIAVPKYLLRADYLATAEDAPSPKTDDMVSLAEFENVHPPPEDELKVADSIQNSKVTQSIYVSAECIPKSTQCPTEDIDALSNKTDCSNKSRLFVFPLKCPGFEVVYPPNAMNESLQLELNESFDSNRTSLLDGSAASQHSYVCDHPPPANVFCKKRRDSMNYSWAKSDSGYAYQEGTSTSANNPPNFNTTPHTQNESGLRNRLHHRFGTYMRHRSPFNHAKQCSGMHCQQPFFRSASRTSTRVNMPTFTGSESFPPYWPNELGGNIYQHQQPFGSYGTGSANSNTSTKAQSPPVHTTTHDEMQNGSPVNGDRSAAIHILPDTLVSGAVNVASSAINTARSVLNMFTPPARQQEPGKWENGHWSSNEPELPRERALRILSEMGFWDRDLNATLLARYNDDLARVISELVQ